LLQYTLTAGCLYPNSFPSITFSNTCSFKAHPQCFQADTFTFAFQVTDNTPAISLCLSLFFASGMYSAINMIQGPQVNDFWGECHYSYRLSEKVYFSLTTELNFLVEPNAQICTSPSLQEFDLIDVTENINLIFYFSLGDSASEVVKSRTNLSSAVIWKDSSCILFSGWHHTWTQSCILLRMIMPPHCQFKYASLSTRSTYVCVSSSQLCTGIGSVLHYPLLTHKSRIHAGDDKF